MWCNEIKVRKFLICLVGAAMAAGPTVVEAQQAQEMRASLFREVDQALQQAQAARADILAPRSFSEGMERYLEAEEDLERGRNLEDIREKLRAARQYFEAAYEATKLAEVTLASALAARDDAQAAAAPSYVEELWSEADSKFEEAARELERGDVNDARRRAAEAEELFREAELEAIKSAYLQETWELLREAKDRDVDERAPLTLARAEQLANQAERILNESRYDTDQPRSLAQRAKIEAQHATYLAERIHTIEEDERTIEEALLAAEEQIRRIAGRMDLAVSFEEGFEPATEAAIAKITAYQDSLEQLSQRLADRNRQVANLEARIGELEERLGGIADERTELVERMEAQARLRQRFANVEAMFGREEGRVLREGDDVIIRLVGLTFPVGEATIEPRHFPLLTKVQRAISEFPDARITVEGHTDSFGGDEQNLRLSQERAEAVRQYLLANMRLDASLVDAIGYGEAQPVASNDTQEGRAKNRRTDIVIHSRTGS